MIFGENTLRHQRRRRGSAEQLGDLAQFPARLRLGDAVAGKQDQALKALREAFQKGFSPEEAQNDPEMTKLRGLPEFAKLSSELNRPQKTN